MKGYIMALLLSMTTMIYGMNVARSIIQEKTSRIFEVMLATAKPSDLLAGKLIGVGAVGLSQIAIWVLSGAAIVWAFRGRALTGEFAIHFSWTEMVVLSGLFCARVFALQHHSLRAWRQPARPSRNCRCTCRWPALPIWLSFALIRAGHQRSRIRPGRSRHRSSRPPRPSS